MILRLLKFDLWVDYISYRIDELLEPDGDLIESGCHKTNRSGFLKINMKYVTVILLLVISSVSHAQVLSGYRFGVNMSTMEISRQGESIKAETPFGVHFGISYEIPAGKKFAFQSGFLFSAKGTDYQIDTLDLSLAPAYLEIPADLVYKIGRQSIKVSLFAGPYFAAAFGGYKSDEGNKMLILGRGENKDLKILDLGFNFGIGLYIRSFLLTVQYGLGMRNISPKSDLEMKNKVIGISLISLLSVKRE